MQAVMQMKWLNSLAETYGTLADATKNVLVFCVSWLIATLFFAAACRICAGWLVGYCTGIGLCGELLATIRPCVGVTVLGALLTQSASCVA